MEMRSVWETIKSYFPGAAVVILWVALQISGYQNLPLALFLAMFAIVLLLLPVLPKMMHWTAQHLYGNFGATHPNISLAIFLVIGAAFGAIWSTLGHAYRSNKQSESKPPSITPQLPATPASGLTTGIIFKDVIGGTASGNVFENVGPMNLAHVERAEDVHIFNNRVTNQPSTPQAPTPEAASESQSKPDLEGTWVSLYVARTLAPPQGTTEKKGITGTGSLICVLLSIANNGAPSIAKNFRLGIRSDSLRTTLIPFRVSDGVVDGFNLRNDKRDIIKVIRASDTMVVKAMNPITKGQPPVVGWLLFSSDN